MLLLSPWICHKHVVVLLATSAWTRRFGLCEPYHELQETGRMRTCRGIIVPDGSQPTALTGVAMTRPEVDVPNLEA